MKLLLVLLSLVIYNQQFCQGAARLRSFSPLDTRFRRVNNLTHFGKLASSEKRELFSYEQTVVIRDAGQLNDKVRQCEVFEIYEQENAKEIKEALASLLKLKVQEVYMEKMMSLLRDCDSVDDLGHNKGESTEEAAENPALPSAYINAVFPGTKWCGFGDTAESYHDLGRLRNVDRCCRSHDFCPIKVVSNDERYNLKNTAIYTKSHCLCDEAFHDCLKKDDGWAAKFIGKIYFDATSPMCIKGLPEHPEVKMQFVDATRTW